MKTTLITAAALTFALGVSSQALAQAQPAPAPQQERAAKAMTAQGELVKVDADAKTITIKSADNAELQFAYNDRTEVQGAREGVAGLATKAGSKVTVQYTESGGTKTATRIEVQAQQ